MPACADLKEFIAAAEERGLLRRVRKEVDWDLELGTLAHEVSQQQGPALLFERVRESEFPFLCGAVGTLERYALGLGLPPEPRTVQSWVLEAMRNPLVPILVDQAPCQEHVLTGSSIDLSRFPAPRWHPLDGGRYLGTLGVVITQDPETKRPNAGIYRAMVADHDKHTLLLGHDALISFQKYQAMGKPMPVATCFGVDPATLTAATAPFSSGEDEMAFAGALRHAPLPLVPAKTVDLNVPANAEFVFEGLISPDRDAWLSEGPFGEFTGYYSGDTSRQPTVQMTAITHRVDPVMQGTMEGRAPNESEVLLGIVRAAMLKAQLLKMGIPGIKDSWRYARDFIAVISLERQYYAGHVQQVIDAVFATLLYKWVIVVDGDVDVFNAEDVAWALGTNVQPHRDVIVTNGLQRGFTLDPSIPPEARPRPATRGSRIGIDATTDHKGYAWSQKLELDPAVRQYVCDHWDEYGLGLPRPSS